MRRFWITFSLLGFVCLTLACQARAPRYRFPKSDVYLSLQKSLTNRLQYFIVRGNDVVQYVTLDKNFDDAQVTQTETGFRLVGKDNLSVSFELKSYSPKFFTVRVSRNMIRGQMSADCFDLDIGHINWYGGPENRYQYWPVEKASFADYSYVTKEADNCAITERYWLNSKGVYLFVEDETPLFIDQNSENSPNQLCFIAKKSLPYNTYENDFTFNYLIGVGPNAREAHVNAVNTVLGKPTGVPDRRMVEHPIWSTWALYKTEIDDSIVRDFANKILQYNFENSQLEIDDLWEICYGSLTFNTTRFPNIKELVTSLKSKGFRVTLWVHPFINKDCTEWYNEAKSKNYLVVNHEGNPDTRWWDSTENGAAYINFTNQEAADWFVNRLKKLQEESGIDSFKFDAGETSWSPSDPVLAEPPNKSPSLITTAYVRTVAQFGPMVEVRSGQRTQDLPIFVRMIDKDSEWAWNNGLLTLVTTLLQLNMAGYTFVLPDMIGGNGYDNHPPNKEMFIRWLQANVFMPSLQFSYVPWQFDSETVDISLKFTKLHADYTDYIMERCKLATETGEPVNAPLWWADPDDKVAQQIYDQFVLGDKIIAAPVLIPGQTERDIYLPKGVWVDGNNENVIHQGPKWIMNYPAPLDVLPYFYKYE